MRETQGNRSDMIGSAWPLMAVSALLTSESRAQPTNQAISRDPIARCPVLEDAAISDVGLKITLMAPFISRATAAKVVAMESVETIGGIRHRSGA